MKREFFIRALKIRETIQIIKYLEFEHGVVIFIIERNVGFLTESVRFTAEGSNTDIENFTNEIDKIFNYKG